MTSAHVPLSMRSSRRRPGHGRRKSPLVEAARRHKRIFAGDFEGRGQYQDDFERLATGRKPAVLAEVGFDESVFPRYEDFLRELEAFEQEVYKLRYWVFKQKDAGPSIFHIYVCKLRSVGLALQAMDTTPLDQHAGAVGLLLGYPYENVVRYARRQAPCEFR